MNISNINKLKYSAGGAVSKGFWFQEFKKNIIHYLVKG